MLGRHVYRVTAMRSGGWQVTKEGSESAPDTLATREKAVALACRRAADDEPSKVVVESANGTVEEERVFGIDPGLIPDP